MATWIVHLRIAELFLEKAKGFDAGYFSIGSIAPDSGIPDENWEHFDPPKEVTHFMVDEGKQERLADLAFFKEYLFQNRRNELNLRCVSFLCGYFYHLVTDNLWSKQIGKPTAFRFAKELEKDPNFFWQVKRDWYGLDFEYIRENPNSIFWRIFLDCSYEQDCVPFLPKPAVQQQLAYIKEFYQRKDEKVEAWYIQRPDIYLRKGEMEAFIQDAASTLLKAHKLLWGREDDVSGYTSVLDLLR
jgi:hypothetical protein